MAMPLIAPSVSPISTALLVPTAWLAVPIATPAATGFFTRNALISKGANMEPKIPVMITAATVTGTIPPCCLEISIAIGVVTDLGSIEAVSFSSSLKARHNPYTLSIEVSEPAAQPRSTGNKFFFRISRCR